MLLGDLPEMPPAERRDAYEALVIDALETGRFSQREAARAYSHHGTRIDVFEPAFGARPMDCVAAGRALAVVAKRTGKQAEARELLGRVSATCDLSDAWAELGPQH